MGGGKGLGRVGRTTSGKDAEGRKVEYSLGIGLGGDSVGREIDHLSPNYRKSSSKTKRIKLGR